MLKEIKQYVSDRRKIVHLDEMDQNEKQYHLTVRYIIIHTELLMAKIKSCIPALWQGGQ